MKKNNLVISVCQWPNLIHHMTTWLFTVCLFWVFVTPAGSPTHFSLICRSTCLSNLHWKGMKCQIDALLLCSGCSCGWQACETSALWHSRSGQSNKPAQHHQTQTNHLTQTHSRQRKFIMSLYKDDTLFAQTHAGRSPPLLTVNRPMSHVLISHTVAFLWDKRESESVMFCLLMISVSGKAQLKFAVKPS